MSVRKLWPTKQSDITKLQSVADSFHLSEEAYNALVAAIEAVDTKADTIDNDLQSYKTALAQQIISDSGIFKNISVTEAATIADAVVSALSATTADIGTLTATTATLGTADITRASIDELINVQCADIGQVNATNVDSACASICNITADCICTGTFSADHYSIDNATIGNACVTNVTSDYACSHCVCAECAEATRIEAQQAIVTEAHTCETYAKFVYNYFTNHNQSFNRQYVTMADIGADGDLWIVLPAFKNGDYKLLARANDGNPRFLWTLELSNSLRNIRFSWSNATEYVYLKDFEIVDTPNADLQFLEVHIDTNNVPFELFSQGDDFDTQTPPSLYAVKPYDTGKNLEFDNSNGTYMDNGIYAGQLHVDTMVVDRVTFDEVTINHNIILPEVVDAYGQPVTLTCGNEDAYITNHGYCVNDECCMRAQWQDPIKLTEAGPLSDTNTLTTEAAVSYYDGSQEVGITFTNAYTDGTDFYDRDFTSETEPAGDITETEVVGYFHEYNSIWYRKDDDLYYIVNTFDDIGTLLDNPVIIAALDLETFDEFSKNTYRTSSFNYNIKHLGNGTCVHGNIEVQNKTKTCDLETCSFTASDLNVKDNIYGGYNCSTGCYTTCGTVGGLITYGEQPNTNECNVTWKNGNPRQIVRKGACLDALCNSEIGFEDVTHETTEFIPDEDSDAVFDEASLAHYTGKTVNSIGCNHYPIKHLDDLACVHGELEVEFGVNTPFIESDENLTLTACCDLITNADIEQRNATCAILNAESATDNITCTKTVAANEVVVNACETACVSACCEVVVTAPKTTVNGETCLCGRTEVNGDVRAHGQLISDGDTVVHGDLYVEGTTHAVSSTDVSTGGDYIVTRESNPIGLAACEYSGLVVNNYDGNGGIATLTADSCGEFRISDSATTSSCSYTCVSNYDNCWYDGLTHTAVTVEKGVTTNADLVDLSDVAYYNGDYYDKNGSDWYGPVTVVNGKFDIGSVITDSATIAALDALTTSSLTYYNSLTIALVDSSTNQPILTRDEASCFENNDILVWDATNKKSTHITRPTMNNTSLVAQVSTASSTTVYTDGTLLYNDDGTAATTPAGTAGTPVTIGQFVLYNSDWYTKDTDWYLIDSFTDNTNWTVVTDTDVINALDAETPETISSVTYTVTGGEVSYCWGSAGSSGAGVAFIGTRACYEVAKLIPEGQDGFIPSGSKVVITDENGYITGEDR